MPERTFWDNLAAERRRNKSRRAVRDAVRARSAGRSLAEVREDLARSYAAAGMPRTNEVIAAEAELLVGGGASVVTLLSTAARAASRKQKPDGWRLEKQRLDGQRWIAVNLPDDPYVQVTLHRYARAKAWTRKHVVFGNSPELTAKLHAGPFARLTLVPPPAQPAESATSGPQIGVFLDSVYIGAVSAVDADAAGLWQAISAAEGADRRLTVQARIDGDGEPYAISVALP